MRQLRLLRRTVVTGGAGTGKTVLAVQRARQLSGEGHKTLFTCFNKPIADSLKRELDDEKNITVATFHSLCFQLAKRADESIPNTPSDDWWKNEAPDLLVSSATATSTSFDALVVDEAQDFTSIWLDALLMLLGNPDSGPAHFFADPHQQLHIPGHQLPADWPQIPLETNCRNTATIAERASAVLEEKCACVGAAGRRPVFSEARTSDDALRLTESIVQRMLDDEVRPRQIVVLSDSRAFVDRIQLRSLEEWAFTKLGGHGIACETIQRFKGLEAVRHQSCPRVP